MNKDFKTMSVAAIVTNDYRSADIFKKYNIDFCCGGKISLQESCKRNKINPEALMEELSALTEINNSNHKFDEWEIDQLANYIVEKHHQYVTLNLSLIMQYAEKVSKVHGVSHPETKEIAILFVQLADELKAHMKKEEMVLFPYISQLAELKRKNLTSEKPPFGSVQNPIKIMEMEHEYAGNLLHRIRELSHQYSAPADACNTYRVLYAKLKEFEDDLHIHVHLENNILFPKAIKLELLYTKQAV